MQHNGTRKYVTTWSEWENIQVTSFLNKKPNQPCPMGVYQWRASEKQACKTAFHIAQLMWFWFNEEEEEKSRKGREGKHRERNEGEARLTHPPFSRAKQKTFGISSPGPTRIRGKFHVWHSMTFFHQEDIFMWRYIKICVLIQGEGTERC